MCGGVSQIERGKGRWETEREREREIERVCGECVCVCMCVRVCVRNLIIIKLLPFTCICFENCFVVSVVDIVVATSFWSQFVIRPS